MNRFRNFPRFAGWLGLAALPWLLLSCGKPESGVSRESLVELAGALEVSLQAAVERPLADEAGASPAVSLEEQVERLRELRAGMGSLPEEEREELRRVWNEHRPDFEQAMMQVFAADPVLGDELAPLLQQLEEGL